MRLVACTLLALTGVDARACPPTIALRGDPALVAEIAGELARRGIEGSTEACPGPRATIHRRGGELVVEVEDADGSSSERAVAGVSTAATVIESFARVDVGAPLLATRTVVQPAAAPPPRLEPVAVHRSLYVSGGAESSFANDRTTWLGATVKLCIQLGPLCASARWRKLEVVDGMEASRHLNELLIGVDLPISLGRVLLVPGFAGGLGGMETTTGGMRRQTGGFRAEAQLAVAMPIAGALAIEVSTSAGLGDFDPAEVMGPAEPWGELRAGLGLRYRR